jgi:deoxycytidylate deaminase
MRSATSFLDWRYAASTGKSTAKTFSIATLLVGRNRDKTHPGAVGIDEDGEVFTRTIHAEMDAISRVKNKQHLKGATIYVARKGRNQKAGMSCPCKMCQGLISKYGLKKAVFTTDYGTGILEFDGEEK